MATDGRKQTRVSKALPPRTLNVQKFAESRAPEIETLHSIVANRVNNDFRSRRNKRRRTTGYDNRVAKNKGRKKQKLGAVIDKSNALNVEKDEKKVPRRVRRRVELGKNPENGYSTSGDGTKRLRTHVWHAKRFTMTKLWGFHLPLGLQGRGRGSRALLKWFKHGAVVHDASYYSAVQLEGPEDSLLSVLKMVLVPPPSAHSEDICHYILSGARYGNTMLHHFGAPVSQSIAPVTYMWRSIHQQNIGIDAEDPNSNGYNQSQRIECSSSFRQLWVWLHASAFSEGYDALKFACQKQMDETGILIKCFSLEGQLAKLDVMGMKAFKLLQKILQPVACFSDNSWHLKKCSTVGAGIESPLEKFSILENEDHISTHAIISLMVNDPRTLTEKRTAVAPEVTSTSILGDEAKEHSALAEVPNKEKESVSLRSEFEENSVLLDSKDIWDASNGISPPVEENVLCLEKHHLRLAFFCFGETNPGELNISNKMKCSRSCPIMLLKNTNHKGSLMGWSIVVPISWVKSFWIPLVSNGAHAIGLREKRWIASEVGLPHFPSDFPDCNAYSCFMATEAAASDQKMERRPPAMRSLRVPIPPPWDSVRLAFDKGPTGVLCSHPHEKICSEDVVSGNLLTKSDYQNCDKASVGHHVVSFQGFVARTSNILSNFLNEIHGDHLLLFPNLPGRKMSFYEFIKDERKLSLGQNGATQLNYDRKLCFLRVLLHTYREGVFEEGAVVCAPHPTDISLWTSSSGNNEEGFQIPQSCVSSYFKEQSSGNWEIQIPADPVARESHRWPIGFVTTGFVRGSKKPVAGALCEAILLARLREEQWKEMPVKRRRKEIYVLVRNLRSTAYRLAIATIVMEQQEDDVEFL
ncbi:hypothetical protein L1049_004284 [Liquidambar formosana]|uniref:Uncharacterized protein n=1 Tax=Liquidambar formosana TaxID=63359 RepID=A0AAP0RN31_LIQFO